MIGAPTFIARSMTLQIFSAYASDSDPPKTVKSWLKTKTSRPSIVPWPVTTPSPRTCCSVEPELRRAMRDERVELDERARVEQQVEALARRQLAPGVLALDADGAAAQQRPRRASARVGRAAPRSSAQSTGPPVGVLAQRQAHHSHATRMPTGPVGTRPTGRRWRVRDERARISTDSVNNSPTRVDNRGVRERAVAGVAWRDSLPSPTAARAASHEFEVMPR